MPRPIKRFEPDAPRGDTLSLRTIVRYDRDYRRPSTPILVGQYVVMRRPIPAAIETEYLIMDDREVVRRQVSIPSEDDCATAIKTARRKRQAAEHAAKAAIEQAAQKATPRRKQAAKEAA
ncbi:beta-hexosaminidase [Burkholderia cenocepacia]|uniref:beta-hexosaminidase n=1 Tax=Burkholderia cenocepacia TaxID=95486 RepID=UPI001B94E0B9|nr:beta-hexosaminidase [Burkholderia cenocepacia]MBR8429405.1 beta-hexosaminidase [Burkholderia cenocepacia]